MEPQDLDYLMEKYSRTPHVRHHEDEYAGYSPRSSFSPFRDPNSKAYAAAMRALQERIRYLEVENTDLHEKCEHFKDRLVDEQNLNDKLSRDLNLAQQYSDQSVLELKKELQRAQNEIFAMQKKSQNIERAEFLGLQSENLNLKNDLDQALREIASNKSHEIAMRCDLRRLEEEKHIVQEELAKEKWKSQEVQEEIREIQGNFERLKQKDYGESEVQRQNQQFLRTIKDLESKCRYLEDISQPKSPLSTQADGKNSKKSVSFRQSARSKSRTSKSTSPSSPRLSRPHNRHIGAHLLESGEFSDKVARMEAEMNDLNKKYRQLLRASKSETNGLGKLRTEIENLASELEHKGTQLYQLKKSQQKP